MSASETPTAPRRMPRGPWVILAIGAAVVAAAQFWPDPEFAQIFRNFFTFVAVVLTLLGLLLWLMFFSGYRPATRLTVIGIAVALALAPAAFVRRIDRDGDVGLIVRWRWEPTEDDRVEAHRKAHGTAAGLDLGDLAGTGPADWPTYQGPNRDGVAPGPVAVGDVSALKPVWKQPCGLGYASFAVAGRGLFTTEQRRDSEAVVCYDADTGKEVWVHAYPARFSEAMGGDGPRATPTVAGGKVYAMGAKGRLVCLDARTGDLAWGVDVLPDGDADNITWGMCGAPLVYDDTVVVSPGANSAATQGHGLVAYDRTTGKELWHAGNAKGAYTSPLLATLAGKRQVLIFDAAGLAGYDDAGGGELWRVALDPGQIINCAQPVVLDGDRVFISTGYGVGCGLVKLSHADGKWSAEFAWKNRNMRCHFNNPVVLAGRAYGLDEGILACIDLANGERLWKGERLGKGQLLLAGDTLVVVSEKGQLVFVKASPDGYKELGRVAGVEGSKTWNCPALAGGRLFVRNHEQMARFDLRP